VVHKVLMTIGTILSVVHKVLMTIGHNSFSGSQGSDDNREVM